MLACPRCRYRDLFDKSQGNGVCYRTVVYDTSAAYPYEPAWDFFGMTEDFPHAAFAANDAIYASEW